jgi:FkbM family methyltransferase
MDAAMLRSFSETALSTLAGVLPRSVRKALLSGVLRRDGDYRLFQELGRKYGVQDIRVTGNCGVIEGSIDDGALLPVYGRTKSWAAASNQTFIDFFARHGGGTYIDVGANIGLTTIPVARDATVTCKAFEPEPSTFLYLARNVKRNCPDRNVELFNVAAFNRSGVVDFELSDINKGDHRIRVNNRPGRWNEHTRATIRVPADCLDHMLEAETLPQPIGAKVDTQGAEVQVFAGGRRVLSRAQLVAFEYWPYGIKRMGGDVAVLQSFAAEHFASGAVRFGDDDQPPKWTPIGDVVQKLRDLAQHGNDPYPYFDILLRK